MRKPIVGGLVAALAAVMFAAVSLAEGTRRNPGYARFAPCPQSDPMEGLAWTKEVIEIQRQAAQGQGRISGGTKAHPPAAPNKPIPFNRSRNCYVGCDSSHEFISAAAATASNAFCAGAEGVAHSKSNFQNERKQLERATSFRAVSG